MRVKNSLKNSRPIPGGEIVLKPGKESVVRRRHPWIFTQAVQEIRGEPGGGLMKVVGSDGAVLGWGLHTAGSLIAVRMAVFGPEPPADRWIQQRIASARRLRAALNLDTDAYRLINAEGDFLPGLIADVYADTVVISIHSRGLEALADGIREGIGESLPGARIYLKRDEHFARVEGLTLESGYISGDGDGTARIREGGLVFTVDFKNGQKTGFYLDQRENRRIAAGLARGKSVLNLFSYTGAFALHAAAAGAARVVSVDSSAAAVEQGGKNATLNPGLDASILEWKKSDVSEYLRDAGRFGLIICDPPPFARRRSEVEGALKGYLGLNQRVLSLAEPGGYVLTFSCSGAVTREDFRRLISEAAVRSGREARLLKELCADADHPVSAVHPEGEYLKGWLIHVE